MKREQGGREHSRATDYDDETAHEKNRRVKAEQARLLRKQLGHPRPARLDELDIEAERFALRGDNSETEA